MHPVEKPTLHILKPLVSYLISFLGNLTQVQSPSGLLLISSLRPQLLANAIHINQRIEPIESLKKLLI